MIKGDAKFPEKIKMLLKAGDPESINLALEVCKIEHPAIWAALLNYTGVLSSFNGSSPQAGIGSAPKDQILAHIADNRHILNIGHKVRYRGMEGCPTMVVTSISVEYKGTLYITKVEAKYYNKSSQSFCSVADRIECFEILT